MRSLAEPREIELWRVFSPLKLALFLYVALLALYVAASPSIFAAEFDSRKGLTSAGLAFFALALAAFAIGARLGSRRRDRASVSTHGADLAPERRRSLAVLLETALVVSVAAYVLWFAKGFLTAGGVVEFFQIWRTNPHRVKEEIMTTVPGVTTLTQLAVAAVPLSVAFGLNRKGSAIRVLTVAVIVLAAARALFVSERLAIVEVVVPLVFLVAGPRKVTVPRVMVYAVAFVVAAATLFAVTELRRTYVYTHDFSASRSTVRFLGYYLTSINNGMVVIDRYPARTPFFSSGEMLWRLPGVRELRVDHFPGVGTFSLAYSDVFDVSPEDFWPQAFAAEDLSYEFNVFTAPGFLAADFGWAALVALLVLGLVSGRLYAAAESSPFHRAFYAIWLVGLLEFMRILYFTNVRLLPAYAVLAAAYVIVRRRVVPRAATRVSLPAGARGP